MELTSIRKAENLVDLYTSGVITAIEMIAQIAQLHNVEAIKDDPGARDEVSFMMLKMMLAGIESKIEAAL